MTPKMTLAAKQAVIPTKKQDKPIAEGSEVNPSKSATRKEHGCLQGINLGDCYFFQNFYFSSLNYDQYSFVIILKNLNRKQFKIF